MVGDDIELVIFGQQPVECFGHERLCAHTLHGRSKAQLEVTIGIEPEREGSTFAALQRWFAGWGGNGDASSDFVLLAVFLSLVNTLAVVACLRLEIAIPIVETDAEAADLLALALLYLIRHRVRFVLSCSLCFFYFQLLSQSLAWSTGHGFQLCSSIRSSGSKRRRW